jgi:copper resistance protein B
MSVTSVRVLASVALAMLWPAMANGQGQAGAPPAPASAPPQDHTEQEHAAPAGPPSFIPPVTDDDRKAAFPEVTTHAVHDDAVHSFLLFDRFEGQAGDGRGGLSWDSKGWIGRDVDRFWFRTEGDGEDGRLRDAQVHALYGRPIARWWDLVAGVRQNVRPGAAQTWAAVGIQGLAP